MKRKIINPFKSVKSVSDFVTLLRAELTELRGKRFKCFQLRNVYTSVYEDGGGCLNLTIEADRTHGHGHYRDDGTSWLGLAEGRDAYLFRDASKLGRWGGFGLFISEGGGSGSVSSTLVHSAYIDLKHLPFIKKIILHNHMVGVGRATAVIKDLKLRQIEEMIVMYQKEAIERREQVLAEYPEHEINFMTGKP